MAVYNVKSDGNAPSSAKAGDYVVTAGGTYEVLDSAAYQGMNAQQLAAAGVGYNPASGLYSKKVSNADVPSGSAGSTNISPTINLGGLNNGGADVVLRNYDKADEWLKAANKSLSAQLQSAYNTNVSNAQQAYNNTLSGYQSEAEAAKANYLANILQNREDVYFDAISAMNGANNRGLVNSAQGQALTNSMLWKGALNASELRSERDTLLDAVYNDINALTKNYNIQLTELEKNKLQDEIAGMSDNQLAYLAQVMEIDAYNANARNTATQNNIAMNFEASEAQKQREWEAQQAALNREWQSSEAALDRSAAAARYGSGGGSGSGEGSTDPDLAEIAYLLEWETDGMTDEQKNQLFKMHEGIIAGRYTIDNWMELYNRYRLNNNGKNNSNNGDNGSGFVSRLLDGISKLPSSVTNTDRDKIFYGGSVGGAGAYVTNHDYSKFNTSNKNISNNSTNNVVNKVASGYDWSKFFENNPYQ